MIRPFIDEAVNHRVLISAARPLLVLCRCGRAVWLGAVPRGTTGLVPDVHHSIGTVDGSHPPRCGPSAPSMPSAGTAFGCYMRMTLRGVAQRTLRAENSYRDSRGFCVERLRLPPAAQPTGR